MNTRLYNPRVVSWTTGTVPVLSDPFDRASSSAKATEDRQDRPDVAHFLVYLENVPDDDSVRPPEGVQWKSTGPAVSGAGNAALSTRSLAAAQRLTVPQSASRPESRWNRDRGRTGPVRAAAETVTRFCRDSFVLRARRHRLRMGPRSLIMGVINVTPDSFSDGGRFLQPDLAVEHGRKLVADGADLIDTSRGPGGLGRRGTEARHPRRRSAHR